MSADTNKQQEFVLRTLEERNIRFVRLWFTDVLGFLKSVAIAPAELDSTFEEGIGFDGSAIQGFAREFESDMLAMPDPERFSSTCIFVSLVFRAWLTFRSPSFKKL